MVEFGHLGEARHTNVAPILGEEFREPCGILFARERVALIAVMRVAACGTSLPLVLARAELLLVHFFFPCYVLTPTVSRNGDTSRFSITNCSTAAKVRLPRSSGSPSRARSSRPPLKAVRQATRAPPSPAPSTSSPQEAQLRRSGRGAAAAETAATGCRPWPCARRVPRCATAPAGRPVAAPLPHQSRLTAVPPKTR